MEKLGFFHGFGQKMVIFHLFKIGKIGQKNVFENILARKKAFPVYKNKRLKKWKDWDFSKRVSPCF